MTGAGESIATQFWDCPHLANSPFEWPLTTPPPHTTVMVTLVSGDNLGIKLGKKSKIGHTTQKMVHTKTTKRLVLPPTHKNIMGSRKHAVDLTWRNSALHPST